MGRVLSLGENVTMEFQDGTKCKVLQANTHSLVPKLAAGEIERIEAYYPGRSVRARNYEIFSAATWLVGSWSPGDPRKVDATLVDVEIVVVSVEWIQRREDLFAQIPNRILGRTVPEEEQKPESLQVLEPFSHANWSLGRRCMVGRSVARIVNVVTKVDVLWQDGEISCGMDSRKLDYAPLSRDKDFWPRQYVTSARGAGLHDKAGVGLVKRIDFKQRTAVVLWVKAGRAEEEHVVGLYELGEHFMGNLGDFLERSVPDVPLELWGGIIRSFTVEGDIEVIWVDGSMSIVKTRETRPQDFEEDDEEDDPPCTCGAELESDEEHVSETEGEKDSGMLDQQLAPVGDGCEKFEQFGIAKNAQDHHFLSAAGTPENQRAWAQRVQKEWNSLESHLPATIYVRVYEDRMDLLIAFIVGPDQTPYQDGLYVFDIYLPPSYPHVPPQVYFRSGGLRLNPYLHEGGTLCLSLLNTWSGAGSQSEMWNPESSNLLQRSGL